MYVRSLLILAVGIAAGAVMGFLLASSPGAGGPYPVPVWLEVAQRVCTAVGGLGTFAALIYVVRQFNLLRGQSDLVQKNVLASLDGQLYARLDSFNKLIVEYASEYELLERPYGEEDGPERRAKLHHLCDLGFTFYEQVHKHHKRYGLLSTEDWEEWQQNMAHFFGKPYVRGYWQATQVRYARSFRDHAEALIARTAPARPATESGRPRVTS